MIVVDVASGKVTVLTEDVNVVRGFSPRGDRIPQAPLVCDGGAFYNDLYSIGVDGSDPGSSSPGLRRGVADAVMRRVSRRRSDRRLTIGR
jgi:hypothetical protein